MIIVHKREKWNAFNIPLYIGYIDYQKAFDSIEHEAILKALRKTGINETYITILEDIEGFQPEWCISAIYHA